MRSQLFFSSSRFELRARIAVVLLALVHFFFIGIISATHLDLARDVSESLKIINGTLLLEGPILAGTIHFGPLWYYLLAFPQLLNEAWMAITFFIGALASLKYFLAYRLGRQLEGPLTDLLWAALLAFPGWPTYAQILPSHTSLIETCTLLTGCAALLFWRKPSSLSLSGLTFSLALALHAHPVCVVLFPPCLCLVAIRAFQKKLLWRAFIPGTAAFLILFLPVICSEILHDFSNFRSGTAFIGGQTSKGSLGHLSDIPAFIFGTLFTGPRIVATDVLLWPRAPSNLLAVLYCLVVFTGFIGAALTFRILLYRKFLLATIGSFAAVIAGSVLLRNITPYYMSFVLLSLTAGLASWGIANLISGRNFWIQKIASKTAFLLVLCLLVCQFFMAKTLFHGAFHFSFFPLFDIKLPFSKGESLPMETAWSVSSSGRWLCQHPGTALQGALPYLALHSYAIGARKTCSEQPLLTLGGQALREDLQIIGFSHPMIKMLKIPSATSWGPIDIFPARRVLHPLKGAPLPPGAPYPPVEGSYGPTQDLILETGLPCDEAVAVSTIYFAFMPSPSIDVTLNGTPLHPFAKDLITSVYVPPSCVSGDDRHWKITVHTSAPDRIGIVTFVTDLRQP